jgi:hypothetical protein
LTDIAKATPSADLKLARIACQADAVRERLVQQLHSSRNDDATQLTRAVDKAPGGPIRIVVLGQYSSGKSAILRCLTGLSDIPIGAGVVTDRSTAYNWHSHQLIDTPGVRAGLHHEHDRIAQEALVLADVVVFVVTVEGLDDVIADYFMDVREHLRTLAQLIIVVNKKRSLAGDLDVVAADLRGALGEVIDLVPVVWTDALSWLEADLRPDPDRVRNDSGIQQLADTLTDVTVGRGGHLKLLTPLRQWSDLIQTAISQLSDNRDEAGLNALDALRSDLTEQRDQLARKARRRGDEAASLLTSRLLERGPDVSRDELEGFTQQAADLLDERFAEDGVKADSATARVNDAVVGTAVEATGAPFDVVRLLRRTLDHLGGKFAGDAVRPGGEAHKIVYRGWHAVGGKFRPGGAVKAAQRIGAAARGANYAMAAGSALYEVWHMRRAAAAATERAEQERAWPAKAREIAEDIVRPWVDAKRAGVEELYGARLDDVASQRLDLLIALSADDAEVQQLFDLEQELTQLRVELSRPTDDDAAA